MLYHQIRNTVRERLYSRARNQMKRITSHLKRERTKLRRIEEELYPLRIMDDQSNFGRDMRLVKFIEYSRTILLTGLPTHLSIYGLTRLYHTSDSDVAVLLLPSMLLTCVSFTFTSFDLQDPQLVVPKIGMTIRERVDELLTDSISLRRKLNDF